MTCTIVIVTFRVFYYPENLCSAYSFLPSSLPELSFTSEKLELLHKCKKDEVKYPRFMTSRLWANNLIKLMSPQLTQPHLHISWWNVGWQGFYYQPEDLWETPTSSTHITVSQFLCTVFNNFYFKVHIRRYFHFSFKWM